MRANLPDKVSFLTKRVPNRQGLEIVEYVKSGNEAHVFRGYDHDLSLDFACKVIPRLNLVGMSEGKDTWRAEIEKANRLRKALNACSARGTWQRSLKVNPRSSTAKFHSWKVIFWVILLRL